MVLNFKCYCGCVGRVSGFTWVFGGVYGRWGVYVEVLITFRLGGGVL